MMDGHGIVMINYGGEFKRGQYHKGLKHELTLDTDLASYADIRDFLKDKNYQESHFKNFFMDPVHGLTHLHSDPSSLQFGELLIKHGYCEVFVSHGDNINTDYLPYQGSSNELGGAVPKINVVGGKFNEDHDIDVEIVEDLRTKNINEEEDR
ncbi:hypothetical protein ACFE04_022713 [Oxalis oulophora]